MTLLSTKREFEFKPLFMQVHENLRARNATSGGDEMMRLRCYEKLQSLVQQGAVKRTLAAGVKTYRGVPAVLKRFKQETEAMNEKIAAIKAAAHK